MAALLVAIITARGGSKGFPGKNVADLAGKPLIAHSILAATECPRIDRVVVTSDDAKIKEISRSWGAEVIDRPAHLATDTARSSDTVAHALEALGDAPGPDDHFVLLQPTSPLRTAAHVTECIDRFLQSGARSGISVTQYGHHPYKAFRMKAGMLEPLFGADLLERPRQELDPIYAQNGAIFVMGRRTFLEHKIFYVEQAMAYEMPAEASIDIDTAADLVLAEHLLARAGAAADANELKTSQSGT